MFSSISGTAEDVAGAIAFLLPGFLAISTFEAASPSVARSRSVWQWTMWSLTVSLILVPLVHALYKAAGWTREPTDPEFYGALIALALTGGYLTGRLSNTDAARGILKKFRFQEARWLWLDIMRRDDQYVIVHLTDGTVLYGYPSMFTDDSREDVREVFLSDPHVLVDDEWKRFPQSEGVLVESPQIRFVQLVEKEPSPADAAPKSAGRSD